MRAIGKYIAIKPIKEVNTKTKGGLILAESQREDVRYRQAEVLNVGTDVIVINKGDNIYFDRHAGFNIEIKNKILKVIQEHDVVIIL